MEPGRCSSGIDAHGEAVVDRSHGARLAAHDAVSAALARCDDRELLDLVDRAEPLGSGIGGTAALLDVGGTPVFVKRVPLTDLETRPENVRSTANLFGLPDFCHYGVGTIGGPGFGAWRELAVHTTTTEWVLARDHEGFPLMHHWRVLPHHGQSLPEELADVDRAVAHWGGGAEVRRRIEALRDSSASIALFLEHIPHNLHDWLGAKVDAGDEDIGATCAMVEEELRAGTSFMNSRGLLHFDGHFQNVLTDGERLYFADYGLAISSGFDLSEREADFFAGHQAYDRRYTATHLVIWLVTALYGYKGDERAEFVRACARGERPTGVPPRVAEILTRHAPVAEVMTDFYRGFQRESRLTPYPAEGIDGSSTT
ncbi:hypothetical protein [Umezawaea sp. Da 62-37]|uniref:hypothetical protein n=1 Tax=Umezawaea sp. Da 62-37 TaxID=3075927 RepID=UPI0028F6F9B2|nr:hypothetical protein [Umezawaea sp. Da 62-37]WNV86968.1 hypothetical protein RM788_01365 [Umezawaea sp. Da 62-37]